MSFKGRNALSAANRTVNQTTDKERKNTMNHNIKEILNSYRILGDNVVISNNSCKTGLCNNDVIIGSTGASKTRSYVIPMLLNSNENLIVTDTKGGSLHSRFGGYLKNRGYNVMCLDIEDMERSEWGYNPLRYIRKSKCKDSIECGDLYNEQDIKKAAVSFIPSTSLEEPYWHEHGREYLALIISFVLNFLPEEEHDLYTVYKIFSELHTEECEAMMTEEAEAHPESTFARRFRVMMRNKKVEKTHNSILCVLSQSLENLNYSATKRLFRMEKQIDFEEFLNGKTALFINVSDSDRSQDGLINLFYKQALQYLMDAADRSPGNRLPIPTRFIMDDFACSAKIENFENIISVIRSREISVSLVLQSIAQLNGVYGEANAKTIIENSACMVYMGGQDVETARYFGAKLNSLPSTVLNLPLSDELVFIRGQKPIRAKKYDLENNPVYRNIEYGEPLPGSPAEAAE